MKETYVLIMAGGLGSRFWPKSRQHFPKQFIDILGTGQSLLQLTYERFLSICPADHIYILSNEQYIDLIAEQLPALPPENIIAEPSRNNTAPCIAYASFKIAQLNPNANMVVAPSDHLILKTAVFLEAVQTALAFSGNNDALVTLGIQPSRPDTGYGYIKFEQGAKSKEQGRENKEQGRVDKEQGIRGKEQVQEDNILKVEAFLEKPSLAKAEAYVASGDYLWNAGIFVWNVQSILSALTKHTPEICSLFSKGNDLYNTAGEKDFIDMHYPLSPNISIDYAIMEKADNVYTIPSDFGWSDLGTWASLYEVLDKDVAQNVTHGHHLQLEQTQNCMIQLPKDKVGIIKGLDNYIVVDDGKVLLIYPKANEQEIKSVAKQVVVACGEDFS